MHCALPDQVFPKKAERWLIFSVKDCPILHDDHIAALVHHLFQRKQLFLLICRHSVIHIQPENKILAGLKKE